MKAVWTMLLVGPLLTLALAGCSPQTPASSQPTSPVQDDDKDDEDGSGTRSADGATAEGSGW